jgi:hypothetical protein
MVCNYFLLLILKYIFALSVHQNNSSIVVFVLGTIPIFQKAASAIYEFNQVIKDLIQV